MELNPVAIIFLIVCAMTGWLIGHTFDSAMIGFILAFSLSSYITWKDK